MKPRTFIGASLLTILVPIAAYLFWLRIPASLQIDEIRLPDGFEIEVFARVPEARGIAVGPDGTLFITSKTGVLYAARDEDGDHVADAVTIVANRLRMPHGLAFDGPNLYLAEVGRIIRFDDIESRLESPPEPVVVVDDLPADSWHGWKYLRIGPDNKLYVPVGSPCNVCDRESDGFGVILRMNLDGSGREVVARGVRNSVGFDWHPATDELWFTDNGRDRLGNTIPPDELNRVGEPGEHFGFPFCHGGRILDPNMGTGRSCSEAVGPAQELGAHHAGLGMRFYTGAMFPAEYLGSVFIAEHGSWNRTPPAGYRISIVTLEENAGARYEAFAEGWLRGGRVSGRPVDIALYSDGSLLVSDDHAGLIYRITYTD